MNLNINDLKEAVDELMSELMGADYSPNISQQALDNYHDRKDMERENAGPADIFSAKEKPIIKIAANLVYNDKIGSLTVGELIKRVATKFPDVDMGDWPDKRGDWKDFRADPSNVEDYICGVVSAGADGYWLQLGPPKPNGCPSHWSGKPIDMSGSASDDGMGLAKIKDWKKRMPAEDRKAWRELEEIYDNEPPGSRLSFADALQRAAANAGVNLESLTYIRSSMDFAEKLAKKQFMSESEKKKKGFGEGEPPNEELYKKREIVQEADLEASAAAETAGEQATAFGDATGAEAEARAALADKQGSAAEAEADYAGAVGKKKDALEKIAKSDELKGKAAEKAGEVADKKDELSKAYTELAKEEQALVKLAQDAAKQSQEASEEAGKAAEEEAKAAEALQKAMEDQSGEGESLSKAGEETASAAEEFGSGMPEFGDALGTDADAAEEKREEDEAAAEEKDAEREAADKEAAAEAESNKEEEPAEEEKEAVEESLLKVIKNMTAEVLLEKKWGDGQTRQKKVRQELTKAGVTADDLRGMVLNTVMAGEEERDQQMIKILKDMLESLQSIEYHMTPAKGAMSKLAQQHAAGWMSEGKVRDTFRTSAKLITEMRDIGMSMEADLYEGFLSWLSGGKQDEGERVKGAIADEIADTRALMQRLSTAYEEKYGKALASLAGAKKSHVDAARVSAQIELDKRKKQMAEVPGHHN